MEQGDVLTDNTYISIAICTYNNAHILDQTLAALEEQHVSDTVDWSVLVVDNNSSDNTPLVVQHYAARGHIPGLRYIREEKQGVGYARKRAVEETASELVAFVDDDCRLEPDWVQQAVTFSRAHPQAGAMGGNIRLRWEVEPSQEILSYSQCFAAQDYGASARRLETDALVGAGLVLRRDALRASRWLERMILSGRQGDALSSTPHCEDIELVFRIRNTEYELWYNPAMRLEHYIPRRRMSLAYIRRLLQGTVLCGPILEAVANNKKPSFPHRLRAFYRTIKGSVRLSLSIAIRDLLLKRRLPAERKMAFLIQVSVVKAAFSALPGRFEI